MTTQSDTNVETRKFDGKNFVLWKEMMRDVLIIQRQVEDIRHGDKPTSMFGEEWRSMDEIARSTIRMQLTLCGRNYTMCTRRNPPHQSWYWFDRYSTWRWERRIHLPPISTPSVGCYLNSPPKGSNLKKKLKTLPSFRACRRVGSILHDFCQ